MIISTNISYLSHTTIILVFDIYCYVNRYTLSIRGLYDMECVLHDFLNSSIQYLTNGVDTRIQLHNSTKLVNISIFVAPVDHCFKMARKGV